MVTIAIPAYKTRFLPSAIKSALSQTYKDLELVILDDGSPDKVQAIVRSFDDARIRFYSNPRNIGRRDLVSTWNQCLAYARGEFFVLFADDDVLEPEYLESMLAILSRYPHTSVVHCRVRMIDEFDKTIGFSPACPEWESGAEFVWHRMKDVRSQYAADFLCSTEALRSLGGFVGFPLAWGSDESTWASLAFTGGIAYTVKPLLRWRTSGVNISQIGDPVLRLTAITQFASWFHRFLGLQSSDTESDSFLIADSLHLLRKRANDMRTTVLIRAAAHRQFSTLWLSLFCLSHLRLLRFDFRLVIKSILYSIGLTPYRR